MPIRLDSHQHFWKYSSADYGWIPPASPLARDWLPTDLAPLLLAAKIDGCIAVQARQSLEETRWLLELAQSAEIMRGVVGWVDLRAENVAAQLEEFSPNPKFVGVRHVAQDEPDDDFLIRPDVQRGIAALSRFGLTYDLLIFPRQLPAAISLVEKFPEQRFVLDHIAKPPIKLGQISPWREQIGALAKSPHVFCKISGMITEADHAHWKAEDFLPYLEVVSAAFGEDRLMLGSDWPVCLLAGNYAQAMELGERVLEYFPESARGKILGENAHAFYLSR